MKRIVLAVLICFGTIIAFAQDFSNKGKDFYLCFPQHVPSGGALATLSIFITSDKASSGTVSMPNGAFSATFSIAANGIQEIQIPWAATRHISNSESTTEFTTQILKKSIRISVDAGQPAVIAYAQQWAGARSAATLLLPANVLGKKYYAIAFTQSGADASPYFARSQFQVIATKDNTVIEITPRKNGVVGTKFSVTLPVAGDMIQYQAPGSAASTIDLTGTLIESIPSGTGACLPIAVYSGSSNVTFGYSGVGSCTGASYDPLWQQCYPTSTWGKNFGFIPFSDYPNGTPYRVLASEDNTVVSFNGAVVATLNAGQIYPAAFTSSPAVLKSPTNITADKPICVAQYAQTQVCSGNSVNAGDPDMVILNPIEQNISDITIFSSTRQSISRNWINVLLPTIATPTFTINGIVPATPWQPVAALPGYSYLRHLLPNSNSNYNLKSDSGFNAIAYGFGNFESYAYSAGTNVKDLYQQVSTSTQYGIETTPNVCTGTDFKFKISLPYQPDSLYWNFLGATNLPNPPLTNVLQVAPVPDSTTIINGKTVYWFSLPGTYNFNNIGVYPIKITAYSPPVPGGCGSQQDIDFDLTVSDPPVVNFTNTAARCVAETVQFTDATTSAKPTYKWYWNFNDPSSGTNNISALKNPSHLFSAPGNYDVRFSAITTAGCVGDTITKRIVIAALPSATIAGTATVCLNGTAPTVTFTGAGGSEPYTFTYNINGGASQTITTTGGAITATIAAPITAAGTFTYNLTGVQNTGSTLCTTSGISLQSAVITVQLLPTATIAGTTTVCQNSTQPNITFTGATGTAPYTFSYTINGGPVLTTTTIAGNAITVAVPTTATGTFVYSLVGVSENSPNACAQAYAGTTATVIVQPNPTATITGSTAVCVGTASPTVTFTGSAGTSPYTFTYNINGGATVTISSGTNNFVTLPVTTAAPGTFTYNLLSVTEGSPRACASTITGSSAVFTINTVPNATISGNTTVCKNAIQPVVTFTGSAGTAPYTFNYTINGVAQAALISTGNIATIPAPTATAGAFIYALTSVTDASSTLCTRSVTTSVLVTVQDLPGGTISGNASVCQNAASPVITFTGTGGTRPYTFTYNIDGGANQTVSTTSASNTVTVIVPTAVAGTFTYNLLQVSEASTNACIQTFTAQSVVVNVNPLPLASVTGGVALCLNATSPVITFTGSNGTAPYTFNYSLNGVAQPALISTGNTATVTAPTTASGIFTYQLVSVTDASSTVCTQLQNGNTVLTIYPATVAAFTFIGPACDARAVVFNSSTSAAGAGTIATYAWDFGDAASGAANTSSLANPSHTFMGVGSYTVTLVVTSSNSCVSNTANNIVVVNPLPEAGFILPEVCLLDPFAQFTDTSKVLPPASITSWAWNFGDPGSGAQNTSTSQNPSHTYTAVGPYNVQLTVSTNSGCTATIQQTLTVNGGNPLSDFVTVNPAANCANDSVTIQNKSTIASGTITRLEIYWDNVGQPAVFDFDEFPVFNKLYRHKFPDFQAPLTRTFQVRVRAFSGGVCFSDKIVPVVVNASPKVQFNALTNACYNQPPFQITQASEIGGVPGNGVFSGPGVSPTGIFSPIGQPIGVPLTIKYTFTSTAGGCVDSLSQTITIRDTTSAAFTVGAPICEGGDASFTDNSVAPAGVVLQNTIWNFGDGTAPETHAPGSTFSHTYPGAGTYLLTMYANSTDGCRSTNTTRNIVVSPIPRPRFVFDKPDYCLPNALVGFNSSSSSISDGTENSFTYTWNFGDIASGAQNTSTSVNPTHTYTAAGTYNVNLSIRSGVGCVHDTTITLSRLHPAPVASFNFGKDAICVDQDAVFIDRSTGADGTLTGWTWNFGDGAGTSTLANPAPYRYGIDGAFPVKLVVTNSFGCIGDTTKTINVYNYPVVDAGEPRFVLESGSVTLQPIVTAIQPRYLWTWDVPSTTGYLNSNVIKNPVSSPLTDVTYTLTVTGAGDCAASDNIFIKLLKAPKIPNTFSPNNDGINDFWVIKYLDTYPKARVQVFTRTGALVFESRGYTTPWNGTKNGKSLPVDTYYYVIEPENGRAPITGYVTIVK